MVGQDSWSRREGGFVLRPKQRTGQSLLSALLQEGDAEGTPDGVFVADKRIAALAAWEVKALDLPEVGPFRLEIRGEGPIASSAFKLKSRLLRHDGKPIMREHRDGVLLRSGSRQYVLLDPLYSILEGIRRYKTLDPANMDARFECWGEIKDLLPEDAVVDQQLQTIQLVRADAFTLDVKEDASFDPVLLSRSGKGQTIAGEDPDPQEALPDAHHHTFIDRFRRLSDAGGHYALGGGWYVVIPEKTRAALSVVHKRQGGSKPARQAFIANPHAALRDELGEDVPEEVIDGLFVEQPRFLSSRVQCLGEWHPKLCAYVSDKGNQWLPEEAEAFSGSYTVGLLLGDQYVSVSLQDAPELYEQARQAHEEGRESLDYQGTSVPVDDNTLRTLSNLVKKPSRPDKPPVEPGTEEEDDEELVPIVIDNLDELGYEARRPRRSGQVGGIPAALATRSLYPHQQEGIQWLQTAWIEGMPGVLLADDMGLGKTLQALAFLSWVQEQMEAVEHPKKPFLMVAPTGLLRNWEGEEETHLVSPGLGTLIRAYGKDLADLESDGLHRRTQRLQEADWVMTTYETLRDRIHTFLPVDWAVVGFDEAQKIKNPGSRMTEMAKSLQADFVVTITGTPVENSLSDLWSLMDASHAGLLGSLREFRDQYQKPAEEGGDTEKARALRNLLEQEVHPAAILRRLKDDHLKGLPTKSTHELREEMPARQAEAYSIALHKGIQGKGTQGAVLEAIQNLRKTSLLAEPLDDTGLTDELVEASARLRGTMRALEDIRAKGEKALIFVEYLDLQEALIPYLQRRFDLPEPPPRISGRVGGVERKRAVDAFQRRPVGQFDVMLLSPKAGGVGLTLTAANHVIHLSRWWNPAVEDQCTDRVYRIGQERDIHIYYPMALHPELDENSFDLTLHRLLERKRDLSRQVLAPPQVTQDELEALLRESASS